MSKQLRLLLMSLLVLVATTVAGCGGSAEENLAPGDRAPGFTLPAAGGGEVSLEDYAGAQPALLYFHMAYG